MTAVPSFGLNKNFQLRRGKCAVGRRVSAASSVRPSAGRGRRKPRRALPASSLACICALATHAAHAAAEPLATEHLLRVTVGLVIVLAVMAMLAWALRRGTRLRMVSGAGLETLGALSLGAGERVVLIRAGDKHLLLGVAPGSVRTLHVLDAMPLSEGEAKTSTRPQGFARYLTAALARSRA